MILHGYDVTMCALKVLAEDVELQVFPRKQCMQVACRQLQIVIIGYAKLLRLTIPPPVNKACQHSWLVYVFTYDCFHML